MEIKIYNPEYKEEWDSFVRNSKNGTFLFFRDFMEYHSDRFRDYSFLFYIEGRLKAILPGNIEEKIYYSHKGLTYGGLIMANNTTTKEILDIFTHLTFTLSQQGIQKIIYKAIPHIYHIQPAEEDLYALFLNNAHLIGRNASSSICLKNPASFSDSRKRGLKKAVKYGLEVRKSEDISGFWEILQNNLQNRYGVTPTHTLEEMIYLKKKFPDEIILYAVYDGTVLVGGCVLFVMQNIVHAQYTAATEDGKAKGAIDILISYMLEIYREKDYFDYGISTEDQGRYLNESLIYQKEGFGARTIVYDIYSIDLKR